MSLEDPYLVPRNTADEVLIASSLTFEDVTPMEVQQAIDEAFDLVCFLSPLESTDDRSVRAEPLRKRAEAYISSAKLLLTMASKVVLNPIDNRILSSGTVSIGSDSPHFIDLMGALIRQAGEYRKQGMDILKRIAPATGQIEASDPLDDE